MTIPSKVSNKLEQEKIKHEVVEHKKVFTAFDAAATLKTKLNQVAKVLLVQVKKDFHLAVLSADKNLDFKKLAKLLKVKAGEVKLPKEKVMSEKFKVKAGAITAFGSLHKVPVVIEKSLSKMKEAIFPSGSFTESLKLKISDYLKLEKPTVGIFGAVKKIKKTGKLKNKKKA